MAKIKKIAVILIGIKISFTSTFFVRVAIFTDYKNELEEYTKADGMTYFAHYMIYLLDKLSALFNSSSLITEIKI